MENFSKEKYEQEIYLINKEISHLKKIKKNLILFSFKQLKNGMILKLDYDRIICEIERIFLEIHILENQKLIYIRLQENL
jgi:hypothetical protein